MDWRFIGAVYALFAASVAAAQPVGRGIEVSFTPTKRAQIAIWVEDESGNYMDTLAVTEAVGYRGVGNRPGATQMNSGYRWPYGRREGILPIWAHRRAAAPDALQWKRVIFQNRTSEGFASRTSNDSSVDDYFQLSFDASLSSREALDAMTQASVFSGDKGRFITQGDVNSQYAEPFVNSQGSEVSRDLSLTSLYPPRRDLSTVGVFDHADAAMLASEASRVMPNLDAITKATPVANAFQRFAFALPDDWPDGTYKLWIEVNVEGDYNATYNDATFPTPISSDWDFWAQNYGYPYRGQPTLVYEVSFSLGSNEVVTTADAPIGYGAMHGEDGAINVLDSTISDDPENARGSGADRLHRDAQNHRVYVRAFSNQICTGSSRPEWCGQACESDAGCPAGESLCDESMCTGVCEISSPPVMVNDFSLRNSSNRKLSHSIGMLHFNIPSTRRTLRDYRIRVARDASMDASEPAKAPERNDNGTLLPIPGDALQIPTAADCVGKDLTDSLCGPFLVSNAPLCENGEDKNADGDCLDPGDDVDVEIAFSNAKTKYFVTVETEDICLERSTAAQQSVTTQSIKFTKVSPCFIATAVYGTPYAKEVQVLRAFRDQYLMTNGLGRAFVRAYYSVGPYAADIIRRHAWAADLTRLALQPLIWLAHWLVDDDAQAAD